jgi:glycosyltransferase involved in cell wall biosynthesis
VDRVVRIVHAADSFAPDVGGIESQVEALARHQQAHGHDVTVITAVSAAADLGLNVVRARPGRWLTVAFPWRNYRMVAKVLDAGPVDVVHAHFTIISPMAIYVARAASRRGIPVAVTVHSLWWRVAVATRACLLPFGWGRLCAAWSAVSTVAAGHVRRTLHRVAEVSVVPNLVDTGWWWPVEPVSRPDPGQVRLILVGRLKKRKHVREFIEVLADVRRRVPADARVRVSIVGEGPRRADLQRQVDRLGLADWVSLLGHCEPVQVRTLLHESDLFIASSRQESFGIAALEARSAGLPVIGYRGNGLSDFIVDGVDGVLVAGAEQMADALVCLIGRPDALGRLRKSTTTTPPSVGPKQALDAVADLYRRARALPERAGPAVTP